MKKYGFLFLIACISSGVVAQKDNPEQIVGVWKTAGEELLVKIDKIGNSFQGRIVWLDPTINHEASLDVHNPNEHMRNMPLKGSKIIEELTFDHESKRWEGGTYYSFKEGKLFNCQISILNRNQLKVSKFIQAAQDAETETWTRQ